MMKIARKQEMNSHSLATFYFYLFIFARALKHCCGFGLPLYSCYPFLSHSVIGLIKGRNKNLLHLGQYLKQTLFAGAALFIYSLLYILTFLLNIKFNFIKS